MNVLLFGATGMVGQGVLLEVCAILECIGFKLSDELQLASSIQSWLKSLIRICLILRPSTARFPDSMRASFASAFVRWNE